MLHARNRQTLLASLTFLALAACTTPNAPKSTTPNKPATAIQKGTELLLADFEQPDDSLAWLPLGPSSPVPANAAETQPTSPFRRSSLRPQAGLWALSTTLEQAGELRRTFATPADLSRNNLLIAQIAHAGPSSRNGCASAALVLTDTDGKRFETDAFPVSSNWRTLSADLADAADAGLNLARIATVGILFRPAPSSASPNAPADTQPAPDVVLTDAWLARTRRETTPGTFSVTTAGTHITISSKGRYTLDLSDRGASFTDTKPQPPAPWLRIAPPRNLPATPPGGLMLLDADALQSLTDFRETGPDDANGKGTAGVHTPWHLPDISWPASINQNLTQIKWDVAWTCPFAALLEGKQESGPYDRLGEPAVQATWRLMAYQSGQVYVHVEWSTSPALHVPEPLTWAFMQNDNRRAAGTKLPDPNADAQHHQQELLYPAPLRQGLATALPHRMQTEAPIAMIARTGPRKDTWWWASGKMSDTSTEFRRYFGAAIVPARGDAGRKRADCMLLVNGPDATLQAAAFSQYLVPPKVIVRQGEIDTTYPGDADDDGFVEPYGFQAIRLANGRATFTLYPQNRPIAYPAFLFTVPAAERKALDLPHARMLITIDGKLFADPPQFPDGSFLLQLPYQIDQPVSIEAIVVRR